MLEFLYNKLRSGLRALDIKIERTRYGYIEKLPKDLKYPEGSLYDAVLKSATQYPQNTALEYYGMQISYKDLIKKINKTAAALRALGVKKGDAVTICMPNTPEATYMFYAVSEIGAVANMVHPLSSEKEIENYVNQADSKIMLTIDISYPKVEAIIKNTPLSQVIVVSASRSMDFLVRAVYYLTKGRKNHVRPTQNVTTWDKFLQKSADFPSDPHEKVKSTDPAVILYSGGTTGDPKGVLLSSLNFNAQALGAKYLVPELLKPRYSMLTFLPNFHAFGLGVCLHIPLFCGMHIVLIPQFNAKKLRAYIKKYRINILVGVPSVFEYLMKIKFNKHELRGIKGVVSGGDMISQPKKQAINDFLAAHGSKAVIQNGYGLTEAAGGMVFSPASIAREPSVIGYPLPDSEVLIVDPKTNKPVKTGETGEILVRGLTIMKEYLNNDQATAETFVTINHKKYLRTGDLGYVDQKGAVFFKARLKRMIISNGYNIYPGTIEEATLKSSHVAECACVGVPDKQRGQKVKVFVVLNPGSHERAAKKDLSKIYHEYLAKYETPREITFIDKLPKTKLSKIDYRELERQK